MASDRIVSRSSCCGCYSRHLFSISIRSVAFFSHAERVRCLSRLLQPFGCQWHLIAVCYYGWCGRLYAMAKNQNDFCVIFQTYPKEPKRKPNIHAETVPSIRCEQNETRDMFNERIPSKWFGGIKHKLHSLHRQQRWAMIYASIFVVNRFQYVFSQATNYTKS